MAQKRYAFVGTWKDFGGHGEGIYVFEIDPVTGDMKETDHLKGCRNNSILSMSPDKRCLYATIEDKNYQDKWGGGGGVLALSFDATAGKLKRLNEKSALGACTSYIVADPQGQYVIITNHGSGLDVVTKVVKDEQGNYKVLQEYDDSTLVMFPLLPGGKLGDVCDFHKHHGKGALGVKGQVCSHLHSVNFDPTGKWILVCDKGCDCIYIYSVDREKGILRTTPHTVFHTRPGTAPRHLEFHPFLPYCFVNNETASTVAAYQFDGEKGSLEEVDYQPMIQMDPQVKPELIGDTYGSPADIHVHPNGKFVYSSQRSSYHTKQGIDCITVFSIDLKNGHLKKAAEAKMDGPCPRGFAIDPEGRFLYAGNQYLDTICRYRIDDATGILEDKVIAAHAATPTCIRIVDIEN